MGEIPRAERQRAFRCLRELTRVGCAEQRRAPGHERTGTGGRVVDRRGELCGECRQWTGVTALEGGDELGLDTEEHAAAGGSRVTEVGQGFVDERDRALVGEERVLLDGAGMRAGEPRSAALGHSGQKPRHLHGVGGAVGAGIVVTALPLAWQTANAAGWVSWEITSIFENIGVVQEGMQTIAVPVAGGDRPGARELAVTRGEIRFEDVSFAYGRRDAQPVLDRLNLTIRPGERVGLVGRSGSGKSTLVNLLLRFYELERGAIVIDGQDIRYVTQESLRAAIGMVTQDTSLLHRSIAANIRYGRPRAADTEVEAAARKAHAHEFIVGLRDLGGRTGYEAHVGERGVKLSGGQRQRIALARVILKNAPVLVLDEATSALDSESERHVQAALEALMRGRTTLVIAHRLSTVERADRIVVLDRGRIVEIGPHRELLARDGLYAKLYRIQFAEEISGSGAERVLNPSL